SVWTQYDINCGAPNYSYKGCDVHVQLGSSSGTYGTSTLWWSHHSTYCGMWGMYPSGGNNRNLCGFSPNASGDYAPGSAGLAILDANGDGKADLVADVAYLSSGSSFAASSTSTVPGNHAQAGEAYADVNGDGIPDRVTANVWSQYDINCGAPYYSYKGCDVHVQLGSSSGTYGASTLWWSHHSAS